MTAGQVDLDVARRTLASEAEALSELVGHIGAKRSSYLAGIRRNHRRDTHIYRTVTDEKRVNSSGRQQTCGIGVAKHIYLVSITDKQVAGTKCYFDTRISN